MAQFVSEFGEMWARNTQNIEEIRGSKDGGQGVYVLYDGSMPVYVGKGNIEAASEKRGRVRGEENFGTISVGTSYLTPR